MGNLFPLSLTQPLTASNFEGFLGSTKQRVIIDVHARSSFLPQQTHESISRAAQQEIRHDCKEECRDKHISPIIQVTDFHLIDRFENHRDDKNLTDALPAVLILALCDAPD